MNAESLICCVCDVAPKMVSGVAEVERCRVRSNVRRFIEESFDLWRCPNCASIHAVDEVDLDHYYANYPIHDVPLDFRTRPMYDKLRRRLMKAGLRRDDRVLDYGCGSGTFVAFLKWARHPNGVGFDAYSEKFGDASVLNEVYDCVVTQDVIEHVDDPKALLGTLDGLVRPGGLIAVGTPNAARLDLADPEAYVHALHQPYHRHILSKDALLKAGEARGWSVVAHYDTMYTNTAWPFVNSRMIQLLISGRDGTLDATLEPPGWKLYAMLPWTLVVGFFGALVPTKSEMMTIFAKPGGG